MARLPGRATFRWAAAKAIALKKHADQPAANSCSGLVPVPAAPGAESLTSRRPSDVRDAPSRPPVVWVLAVYSTFSTWFMVALLSNACVARSDKLYRPVGRVLHRIQRGVRAQTQVRSPLVRKRKRRLTPTGLL